MALTRVGGGIFKQPIDVGIITATSVNASGIVTAGTVQIGAATTIHTTGIDLGSGNITSHNINSTGIITATSFVGPVTGNVTGNTSGTASNLTGSPSINVTNITASGNVSIAGTLTYEDVTNIDSVGIITAQSDVSIADKIIHTGDTNTAIRFPAADTFTVETNGSERLRITSAGLVGIGLTNPEKLLEVSSSSSPTIRINNSDGSIQTDQTIGALEFKANDNSGDGSQVTGSIESIAQAAFTGQGTPSHLIFKTNGVSGANALTERLRITSAGALNIGKGDESGAVENLVELYVGANDTSHATIRGKYNRTNEYNRSEVRFGVENNAGGKGFLAFATGNNSATEKLRIDSAGNVNIGPSANANEHGLLTLSQSAAAAFNALVIQQGNTAFTATDGLQIGIDAGVNAYFKLYENRDFYFTTGTSNTEKLRIDSAGNTTLGYAGSSLHFQNGFNNSTARIQNGGGSNSSELKFLVKNAGTESEKMRLTSTAGLAIVTAGSMPANAGNETLYVHGEGHNGHGTSNTRSVVSIIGALTSNSNAAGIWMGARTNENTAVIGTRTASGNLAIETYSGGWGERLRITSGGYVNIGGNLTQTSYTAQVTRIGGNTDVMQIKGNTGNSFIRFTDSDATSDFTLGSDDGAGAGAGAFVLYDRNQNAYRTVVTSSGTVGINATNPSSAYKLEVNGAIRSGTSGANNQATGGGFRQHEVAGVGVGNRLIYNVFDGYYAEKAFTFYFPNGVANQAIRIHSNRNSWWSCGFITIHSTYSNQNASGMLRYEFTHAANTTSSYGKTIDVNVNRGLTSGNFGMSNSYSFKTWGSNGGSADSHALEIRHLTSTGNACNVVVELYGTSAATYIDDLYLTTGHTY